MSKALWKGKPEERTNKLIEIAARWKWMCDLLDEKEVSDFALSFSEVRKLDDIMRPWREANKDEGGEDETGLG